MEEQDDFAELAAKLPALAAPAHAGALKAFSRLLGGLGSYASAWMRRPTQKVEDRTDATSLVTRRLAEAAANLAASDPDIVERALQNWLPSELRRQANKQKIAAEALAVLSEDQTSKSAPCDQTEIDDDWLNSFERFAEDASSRDLQELWGKVLAGEIARPGSFSRTTLRFLHELDRSTAEAFESVSKFVLADQVFTCGESQPSFDHLLKLEAAGILSAAGGIVNWGTQADDNGRFFICGQALALLGVTQPAAQISIPACPLTQSGRELLTIVPNPSEESILRLLAEVMKQPLGFLDKVVVKGVALGRLIKDGLAYRFDPIETIWGDTSPTEIKTAVAKK